MKKSLHCILLLTIVFFWGCDNQTNTPKPSGKVVKIGVIAPMSGPDKKVGENTLIGIKTALKMQSYLSNGDKIELVVVDNKSKSVETISALEKLHDKADVAGVLLMAKSDVALAVVPLAEHYKIPVLALIATHPDVTKGNSFVSQLGFDDIFQGTIAALYVRDEMLINKVAVFSDVDNVHYSFLANEFVRKFSSVGGEIEDHITRHTDKEDLKNNLERLKEKDVHMLYLAVSPERVLQMVKIADEIGWSPKIMGSDGLLSSIILNYKEDTSLVNGIMATDFYSTALPKTEYGKKAVKLFNKHFSEPGTTFAGLAGEGTSIFIHAMDNCGNKTDRECINYNLRHTDEFQGIYGKISIHENGKVERPIFVNIIEDQKLKFLVKVY